MMEKIMGILIVLGVMTILFICYLVWAPKEKKCENNNSSLLSLEYIASSLDDEIKSIFIKDYKMTITYRDKSKKELFITEEDYRKIEKLFIKYKVLDWHETSKKDLEIIDGEDTQVFYEFTNQKTGHVCIQECPKGGLAFFYDLKKFFQEKMKL